MDTLITIRGRTLLPMQSTGRLGKSTAMQTLMAWLKFGGVPYKITDADSEHRTISERTDEAVQISLNDPDDLLRVLSKACKSAPVELIDVPAQKTDYILEVLRKFNLIEIAEAEGIRFTVLLFAADDASAEQSMMKIIQQCGDKVDYIMIKNPARYKSRHYEGSPVQKTLAKLGTPEIVMPALTQSTLDELQRAKLKTGKWLTFSKAASSDEINKYAQHEIQFFLNRMYAQWHDVRSRLIPESVKLARTPDAALGQPSGGSALGSLDIHLPE